MNIDQLQRDPAKVHAALKDSGESVIAVKPCKIYVPENYIGSFLGAIEEDIRIVGIFGIVVEDKYYASSVACAMVQIAPSTTSIKEINGEKFMEFSFEPGDTVIVNTNLVKVSTFLYRIYAEIIAKGNVPWYLSYEDMCYLLETGILHSGVDLGVNMSILSMITTSIARDSVDKMKFFRHTVKNAMERDSKKPVYVPLRSVALSATNTTSKLMGAYFQEGVTSALINPSTKNEPIEDLLRK